MKTFLQTSQMKSLIILSVLPILVNLQDFQFPTENDFPKIMENNRNLTEFLEEIRGTASYEQEIDNIISGGISKLTLAISNAASSEGQPSGNVIYSPASVAGALALLLLGANGKTFHELSTFMGLATGLNIHNKSQIVHEQLSRLFRKLEQTTGFDFDDKLKFASAIFVQNNYPIRPVYKELSEKLYKSEVLNLDFATNGERAKTEINNWVAERTNNRIKDMLPEAPSRATKVIIVSALYFMALWEKPFFNKLTKKKPFYPNGRNGKDQIVVEMMANGGYFPYFKDAILDCAILGLPYKGNKTTMYVVVPNDSDKTGLRNLENSLTPFHIKRLLDNTKYTEANILFPKMKIENTLNLETILQKLGIQSLFNPNEANLALISPGNNPQISQNYSKQEENQQNLNEMLIFSRLGHTENPIETLDEIRQSLNSDPTNTNKENPGLFASKVVHKVYMDITESGTEAAAATSVVLLRSNDKITFRVDVPFLCFIMHEETKMFLFWGSVTAPQPQFSS